MTQKTAMQQMIEMIESVRRDEPPTALWNLKKYAQELLATEKQQIIDAYVNKELFINNPIAENEGVSRILKETKLAEQYYEQTFGNFPSSQTQTE